MSIQSRASSIVRLGAWVLLLGWHGISIYGIENDERETDDHDIA